MGYQSEAEDEAGSARDWVKRFEGGIGGESGMEISEFGGEDRKRANCSRPSRFSCCYYYYFLSCVGARLLSAS